MTNQQLTPGQQARYDEERDWLHDQGYPLPEPLSTWFYDKHVTTVTEEDVIWLLFDRGYAPMPGHDVAVDAGLVETFQARYSEWFYEKWGPECPRGSLEEGTLKRSMMMLYSLAAAQKLRTIDA